jgi:tetratricopeptide (TPR) repeat protein
MSTEAAAADEVCASCGVAAVDDVKLKGCDYGCDLVKYCSDICLNDHRKQHEEECKKRAAELRDNNLFTPPEGSHLGECPICCLPQSVDIQKSTMLPCCYKRICVGCNYANQKREHEAGLQPRCAFCREPVPKSQEEANKYMMKRIKKNDPAALRNMGMVRIEEEDFQGALEYWTKAAELGNASAHHNLAVLYHEGKGVEKDTEKYTFHSEEAAIRGHDRARYNLGVYEWKNNRFERARKHFIIGANLGEHDSLSNLKELYIQGHASKEDYADALRAYQAAVDAVKSEEREEAEEAMRRGEMMQIS